MTCRIFGLWGIIIKVELLKIGKKYLTVLLAGGLIVLYQDVTFGEQSGVNKAMGNTKREKRCFCQPKVIR